MSELLGIVVSLLFLIAFGIWIYSLIVKKDFIEVLKELWEMITNE